MTFSQKGQTCQTVPWVGHEHGMFIKRVSYVNPNMKRAHQTSTHNLLTSCLCHVHGLYQILQPLFQVPIFYLLLGGESQVLFFYFHGVVLISRKFQVVIPTSYPLFCSSLFPNHKSPSQICHPTSQTQHKQRVQSPFKLKQKA